MEVDKLKFLLAASAYLQGPATGTDAEHLDDLQAVDRILPDCDWFELGEGRAAATRRADEFWADRGLQLDF